MATFIYPNGPTELQRWYSDMLRDSLTPEVAARHIEVLAEFDGTSTFKSVEVSTLVLAMSGRHDVENVRAVAALIPGARLVTVDGDWGTQDIDPSQMLAAVRSFLDEADAESESVESQPAPGGFATILFTDMESSTSMRQQIGDEKAQEIVHVHNDIVRDALKANGGREIKHTGDGIMASFGSASQALQAAVTIQRSIAAHVEEQPDVRLRVYIGLNAGEPIAEEGDLFGTSVDLAKRICDQCQPGEILISDVVRQLVAGKEFLFSDRGDTTLRGFEDPVRLYEVRWREDA